MYVKHLPPVSTGAEPMALAIVTNKNVELEEKLGTSVKAGSSSVKREEPDLGAFFFLSHDYKSKDNHLKYCIYESFHMLPAAFDVMLN